MVVQSYPSYSQAAKSQIPEKKEVAAPLQNLANEPPKQPQQQQQQQPQQQQRVNVQSYARNYNNGYSSPSEFSPAYQQQAYPPPYYPQQGYFPQQAAPQAFVMPKRKAVTITICDPASHKVIDLPKPPPVKAAIPASALGTKWASKATPEVPITNASIIETTKKAAVQIKNPTTGQVEDFGAKLKTEKDLKKENIPETTPAKKALVPESKPANVVAGVQTVPVKQMTNSPAPAPTACPVKIIAAPTALPVKIIGAPSLPDRPSSAIVAVPKPDFAKVAATPKPDFAKIVMSSPKSGPLKGKPADAKPEPVRKVIEVRTAASAAAQVAPKQKIEKAPSTIIVELKSSKVDLKSSSVKLELKSSANKEKVPTAAPITPVSIVAAEKPSVVEKAKYSAPKPAEAPMKEPILPSVSPDATIIVDELTAETPEGEHDSDELEEGEVEETETPEAPPREFLPVTETRISDFTTIAYPFDDCTLPTPGLVYSVDFLLKFSKYITARPVGMPSTMEIFGVENRRSHHRYGGTSMSRGPSGSSHRSNKDRGYSSAQSGGRKGSGRGGQGSGFGNSRSGQNMRRQDNHPLVSNVPVAPLVRSENAWVPKANADLSQVEAVVKAAKGLLNKLTIETFNPIATKIVNSDISSMEVLDAIVSLIFDKAVMEPHFGGMYASLCYHLTTQLPTVQPWVISESNQNAFRANLVKKCQIEFQSGAKWALEAEEEQKANVLRRQNIDSLSTEEKMQIAEEDYERKKLKRRSLGNTKFVGELFLKGLISEKTMHYCVTQCLSSIENPEEESVESLCKLMTTIGKTLSSKDLSGAYMDSYFGRIAELSEHPDLPSRIKFMLVDLIELRANRWVARAIQAGTGPATIAEIHKQLQDKRDQEERDALKMRKSGSSRGHRGDGYGRDSRDSHGRDSRDHHGRGDARDSFGRGDARDSFGRGDARGDVRGGGFRKDSSRRNLESRPVVRPDAEGWTSVVRTTSQDTRNIKSIKKADQSGDRAWASASKANKFDVLTQSQPATVETKVEEKTVAPPLERLVKSFEDFKATLESADLIDDFNDFGTEELVPKFVSLVLQHILDTNAKHIDLDCKLLEKVFESKYSKESLWTAFNAFLVSFEDDKSDFPNGFKNLSQLLVKMMDIGYLSKTDLLAMAVPLAEYMGMRPAGAEFIGAFLEVLSQEQLVEFIVQEPIALGTFWPADKQPDAAALKKWCGSKSNLKLVCTICELAQTTHESTDILQPFIPESINTAVLSTSILDFVGKRTIFFENPSVPSTQVREMFPRIKESFEMLQLVILAFFHSDEDLLTLLEETEKWTRTQDCQDYLEPLFRILYNLTIVPDKVFFAFKDAHAEEAAGKLEGWFKYLADDTIE